MATTKTAPVRISEKCYKLVKGHAAAEHRTIAGQLEYLVEIGQLALDNPELPISLIKDTLIALKEEPLVGEDITTW